MSDVVTPPVEPVVEPKVEEPKEENVDNKIKEAMDKYSEQVKSEISGLNRRNTELEKELEAEKTAHMSDKDKLEYEKEQRDKDLAEREERLVEAERKNVITSGLAEKGLDLSVSNLMNKPTNAAELVAWLETFESLVNPEVEKQVNIRLSAGGKPTSGGTPTTVKPLNSFEDAKNASEEDFKAYLETQMGE